MEESSRRAVDELSVLLWGQRSNADVFKRWRQGFIFSTHERSALLQLDGGPCSVIASVQAFIIKNLFNNPSLNKDQLSESDQRRLLAVSMCDILKQASNNNHRYVIAHLNNTAYNNRPNVKSNSKNNNNKNDNNNNNDNNDNNNNNNNNDNNNNNNNDNNTNNKNKPNSNNNHNKDGIVISVEGRNAERVGIPAGSVTDTSASVTAKTLTAPAIEHPSSLDTNDKDGDNNNNNKEKGNRDSSESNVSLEEFHRLISTKCYGDEEGLQGAIECHIDAASPSSCLLFLYSVLFTKSLESLRAEMSEAGEPLIDPVHGHGTQSLTNLLLTGQAVSHVWDNVKELSGLKLTGISAQSQIGFLTLLEHLRYIEVGWYLKSPKYPIWLLASETHLTVFFSQDMALLEDNNSSAKRIFNHHDKEGRGFIACDQLISVMNDLNLFSDPQYVDLMLTRLDPEQLGIVTMETFLQEFFPETNSVRKAKVFHYNGLCRSCPQDKVRYMEGEMTFSDLPELQMMADDTSPIRTCLMTRWPAVEVVWMGGAAPSLN